MILLFYYNLFSNKNLALYVLNSLYSTVNQQKGSTYTSAYSVHIVHTIIKDKFNALVSAYKVHRLCTAKTPFAASETTKVHKCIEKHDFESLMNKNIHTVREAHNLIVVSVDASYEIGVKKVNDILHRKASFLFFSPTVQLETSKPTAI